MQNFDTGLRRLHTQHIAGPGLETPGDVVRWLGAVQAQDYSGALWAIGLRTRHVTEATIEQAIADKTIVRVWFMRGTLHFVPAADIRWMLALMRARLRRLVDSTGRYNNLELDETTLAKTNDIITGALRDGGQLTRTELAAVLEQAGVAARDLRLSLILQRAQADGLVCYGPRRGRQATFVLLDEWLPPARVLEHDEALAELALRYFTSHGPATLQDFAWWSGLTVGVARAGFDLVRSRLEQEEAGGRHYWFSSGATAASGEPGLAYLLPNYDEYTVGYTDRAAALDARHEGEPRAWNTLLLGPVIVVDGRAVGIWKRTLNRSAVAIEASYITPPDEAEKRAVEAAAERYGRFLGVPVIVHHGRRG